MNTRVRRPREERDYVWTCEMPNLRRTARRRRTGAAAHEGSRPDARAVLRRPLSTLSRVCSLRRCECERDGVQRVELPRARTSAERSTPRSDRPPQSARLAGRPRLRAVDEVGFDARRPTSGPEHALSIMLGSTPCQELFKACYRVSVSEYLVLIGAYFFLDIQSEHFVFC
jgi:hypothetical protein